MRPGTLQGSILASFGERLDAVGALSNGFWAFLGRSGALLGCFLGLVGTSHLILDGFWEGLGRFCEDLARILRELWRILEGF